MGAGDVDIVYWKRIDVFDVVICFILNVMRLSALIFIFCLAP